MQLQMQMDALLRAACRVGGRHCIPFGGGATRRSVRSWTQGAANALGMANARNSSRPNKTFVSSYTGRNADNSSRSRSSSAGRHQYADASQAEAQRGRGGRSTRGRTGGRSGFSSSDRTQRAPQLGYDDADRTSDGRASNGWQQQQQPGSSFRGGRGAGRSSQWGQGGRGSNGGSSSSDGNRQSSNSGYGQSGRGRASGTPGGYSPRRTAPYERSGADAFADRAADFDDGGFSEGEDDWGAGSRAGRSERAAYGGERSMRRRGRDSEDGFEWPQKPSKASLRDDLFGEVLYGVAPVLAALRLRRRAIHALYVQDSMDLSRRKDAGAVREAVRLAGEAGAAVREAGKHELNMLTDSRPHQGLVLDCGALEWAPLEALLEPAAGLQTVAGVQSTAGAAAAIDAAHGAASGQEASGAAGSLEAPAPDASMRSQEGEEAQQQAQQQAQPWDDRPSDSEDEYEEEAGGASPSAAAGRHPVWLALDEVADPQNLGAIIRSAYCLGATGILASAKNCAPLSAVVSKASAGVLEAVPLHSCKNMQRTLADAASRGWAVLGASAGRGALPLGQLAVDRPTVLVLGNEGYGLRTNVRRACTQLVRIDMGIPPSSAGMKPVVDSLNVSVAAGILLHHLITSSRAAVPSTPPAAVAAEQAAKPQ